MSSANWFGSLSTSELHYNLCELSDRKLHLLTAAFLRRVWDDLPSDHTRLAVEATEKFADGRITVGELARLRSADLLDSCEPLWTLPVPGTFDEELIGVGDEDDSYCDWRAEEYERWVTKQGYVLDGVRAGVKRPEWIVVKVARYVREMVAWKAERDQRDEVILAEASAQEFLFHEIAGPGLPHSQWPQWRTTTVVALARGIYRDQAYDRLPILADALQDADCNDDGVLQHCREAKEHVRGCWLVDLAIGIG
ncbi:MAG: hypothetical protein L0241_25335 [Planctomycetia bacterium]|nr:hypothetical protein [Planctomycetia bacterium]